MMEGASFYRVGNVLHVAFRAEGMRTAPKPVPYWTELGATGPARRGIVVRMTPEGRRRSQR